MALIREARDTDVERLRDLFALVYGEDYPFEGFYDTHWLKKSVFNDNTVFLVAEVDGNIVATGSMMLDAGGQEDMIGELGRLVAAPSKQAAGSAKELVAGLLERIGKRVQFSFGEVRTLHRGSQRLAENFGWTVAGFEPLKYRFAQRESVAVFASLKGLAPELRRNNPRVIPEVFPLAQTVLKNIGLPVDVICQEENDGYPTNHDCTIERMDETGISPLLRIERGRVRSREVFGNLSISHGFFQIAAKNTHYLLARKGDSVMGAVGFLYDPIDSKVRILELVEFDDAVKGYLLSSVDRIAREEFGAAYQEVDVSAYSPRIQRTLERLGFVPVAYCPSMVFENVERLDVIRMAKLNVPYDLGEMKMLASVDKMRQLVERGLEDKLLGMEITDAVRKADLFGNLPEGDLHHLSRICHMREYDGGTKLIRKGDVAKHLYVIAEGSALVRDGEGKVIAELGPGSIFGEMALVEHTVRSADVTLPDDCKIIEIETDKLERLCENHPRLGYIVLRNLAGGLSRKLRRQTIIVKKSEQ